MREKRWKRGRIGERDGGDRCRKEKEVEGKKRMNRKERGHVRIEIVEKEEQEKETIKKEKETEEEGGEIREEERKDREGSGG
jgi:hypothetical protein